MKSFFRHFFCLVCALIIIGLGASMVVFNVINVHFTNPDILADAAQEVDYAQKVAVFVEDSLGSAAGQMGLDSDVFSGTIPLHEGIYDEIRENISRAYAGEPAKVDTAAVESAVRQKLSGLPGAILESAVKMTLEVYETAISFEVVAPAFLMIQEWLSPMTVMNILFPIVMAICYLVILLTNRRRKRARGVYVSITLLATGLLSLAGSLAYTMTMGAGDFLTVMGVDASSIGMDISFAADLVTAFADSMVTALTIVGAILTVVGLILLIVAIMTTRRPATRRQNDGYDDYDGYDGQPARYYRQDRRYR